MGYKFLDYRVGAYMTPNPVTVSPDMTLRDAQALFDRYNFNSFPVVEDGRLVGIVTKLDFLKAFALTTRQLVPHYDVLMQCPVRDVMSTTLIDVRVDQPLTRALQSMVEMRARSLPVVDDGSALAGMIAREDIMRALKDATAA